MFRLSIISLLLLVASESQQADSKAAQMIENHIKEIELADSTPTDPPVKEHKRPFTE